MTSTCLLKFIFVNQVSAQGYSSRYSSSSEDQSEFEKTIQEEMYNTYSEAVDLNA